MAITLLDKKAFKAMPDKNWVPAQSHNKTLSKSRLSRMVKNGLLQKTTDDCGVVHYMKNNVTRECCKCGTLTNESECNKVPDHYMGIEVFTIVCPKCGNDGFYRLDK